MRAAPSRSWPTVARESSASRRLGHSPKRARGCASTSTMRRRGARPEKRSRVVSPGTRRSHGCWHDPAGSPRVRGAFYSPLPPERSGIADYSSLLLPALARLVEVEVVRRGKTQPLAAEVAPYPRGNDPEPHGPTLQALRGRPASLRFP